MRRAMVTTPRSRSMSFQRRATELAAAGAGGGSQDDADALMALCHHLLGDTSAGVHDALGALDPGHARARGTRRDRRFR